jgi:hypothetical protein
MSKYDQWLESPYQDDYRNGGALEAYEAQYLESDEFRDAFEIWQQNDLPEFQPISASPLDIYMDTTSYERGLTAYIEARVEAQAEWEETMFSEDYAEETRTNFLAGILRKVAGR